MSNEKSIRQKPNYNKSRAEILQDRPIMSNVVEKEELRIMQGRTLNILRDALSKSFGPYGSNTVITKVVGDGTVLHPNEYTKDGHTILKNILFQDVIEMSTKDSIEDITRSIVTKVGDGTTSAVILSDIIFKELTKIEQEDNLIPYDIIEDFTKAVEEISERIVDGAKEFTPRDAYDIAYVSTNGNTEIAETIGGLYETHGADAHIDIGIAPGEDTIIREYEGIIHHDGYLDSRFITSKESGMSEISNPEIYIFEDPIDNNVIAAPFMSILENNIHAGLSDPKGDTPIKNTVIVAPTISIDYSPIIDTLMDFYNSNGMPGNLLIVTGTARDESMSDLATMTGAKLIKKYIDADKYKEDLENDLAAGYNNVHKFAGGAELVKADYAKTMFINPKNQFDENMEYSKTYTNLVESIQAELNNAEIESTNTAQKRILRRRIMSLTSSNIDYLVGGLSTSDRDNIIGLLDDAVKNCRSAAEFGYGQGANLEGYRAAGYLMNNSEDKSIRYMHAIIFGAYKDVINTLLDVSGIEAYNRSEILDTMMRDGKAYNLRTKEFDGKVKTSIMSDPNILEAISKIVTRMVTANQFICPDIHYNRYMG